MKKLSQGEETFWLHCRVEGLNPERQFRFCKRKWTFDFAFEKQKLAVEIEGGLWTYGRHNRASGFIKDCAKYNSAVKLGWHVLRYPTEQVIDGTAINDVLEMVR